MPRLGAAVLQHTGLPKAAASTRAVSGRTHGSTFGVQAPAKHHGPARFPQPPFSEPLRQQYFLSPNPADFRQRAISSVSVSHGESILVKEMSSSSLLPRARFGTEQTVGAAPMGQGAGRRNHRSSASTGAAPRARFGFAAPWLVSSWMTKGKAQQYKPLHLGSNPFLIKL